MAAVAQKNDEPYLNVSSYKFTKLEKLQELKVKLKNHALGTGIKGTILISDEGVNLFLSGLPENVHAYNDFLADKTPIGRMEFKESFSSSRPFKRTLVRIKKEIISMGMPEIKPELEPAPRISVEEFKNWLDVRKEGKKDFVVLDTRNDYELKIGKFNDSVDLDINTFRTFPEALNKIEDLKDKTIVTLCTGGIRCEKAAPLMQKEGFKDVYQLDGGILKYFEENGSKHYDGECFVFDQRVAVDGNLHETKTEQCFACRTPLTLEEQSSSKYKIEEYCPHCYDKNGIKQES